MPRSALSWPNKAMAPGQSVVAGVGRVEEVEELREDFRIICESCRTEAPDVPVALGDGRFGRPQAEPSKSAAKAEAPVLKAEVISVAARPWATLVRVSGSMFADERSKARIFMCADCRVADLYSEEKPLDIRDLPR